MLKFHRNISTVVFPDRDNHRHRTYAMWTFARSLDQGGWFYVDEFVELFSKKFNCSKIHVKHNLIPSGKYVFWDIAGDKIFLRGKWSVCKHYNLYLPGQVYFVPEKLIFGKLQKLRTVLFEISVANRMLSRFTQEQEFGYVGQTFINYQKIGEKDPVRNFTKEKYVNEETGELQRRQLSNLYLEPFMTKSFEAYKKKYGWKDTVGTNPENDMAANRSRLYFRSFSQLKYFVKKGWVNREIVYVWTKNEDGLNLWQTVNNFGT